MSHAFDAYVAAALYAREGAVFALGDGTVRFEQGGAVVQAHDGAVLAACVHPSGEGVVTGGDDGRLVWSRPAGATVLADLKGKWIDALDASPASGLIVFAAGREVHVRDVAAATVMACEKHVSGMRAFNVGSGTPRTVGEMAAALAHAMSGPSPRVTGQYRLGDVRHITADSSRLCNELDWRPRIDFAAGMAELAENS